MSKKTSPEGLAAETSGINPQRLYSLFKDMVDIYSPSGKEESISEFLFEYLKEHLGGTGCRVIRQEVEDERYNILVTMPGCAEGQRDFELLLLGHMDTVPAFDIEQQELVEGEDGRLYGLGTADMKGGCAALVESLIVLGESGRLPQGVMLALVVGEEESGDGTEALLASYRFTSALVAEPTELAPCLEHYGYLEMQISTMGHRRHAALSGRETNAVTAMLHLLLQLEEQVEAQGSDMSLNIRDLRSSRSGFAVPDSCNASLDFHLPPDRSVAAYARNLETLVPGILAERDCTGYELEFPTQAEGFSLGSDAPLAQGLKAVWSRRGWTWEGGAFTSHSDANLLQAAGCSVAILGPGSLSKAHTNDESVDFAEVLGAADIYVSLLARD